MPLRLDVYTGSSVSCVSPQANLAQAARRTQLLLCVSLAHRQAQICFGHEGYLLDGSLYRGVRRLGLFEKLKNLLKSLLVWFPVALHLSKAALFGSLQWQQTDRHVLDLIPDYVPLLRRPTGSKYEKRLLNICVTPLQINLP